MSQDIDDILETRPDHDSSDPATDGEDGAGDGTGYIVMAFIFIIVALVLIGVGFDTMLTYDSSYGSSDQLVGGDAYNYIIRANRGVGFISGGIASTIIAATFAVLSVRAKISTLEIAGR